MIKLEEFPGPGTAGDTVDTLYAILSDKSLAENLKAWRKLVADNRRLIENVAKINEIEDKRQNATDLLAKAKSEAAAIVAKAQADGKAIVSGAEQSTARKKENIERNENESLKELEDKKAINRELRAELRTAKKDREQLDIDMQNATAMKNEYDMKLADLKQRMAGIL